MSAAASSHQQSFVIVLRTLILGAAGGWLFSVLGMPLPWLTGPIAVTATLAIAGIAVEIPSWFRPVIFVMLGLTIGSRVNEQLMADLASWPLSLALLVLYVPAAIATMYAYFRLVARVEPNTALVSSTPGSLSYVLAYAADSGADTRKVVRGEAVYQGDWLETDPKSRAKILLNDDTELVVGPASRLHLDEFVYNAGSDKGKVLIEMGVGLLRFTSGKLEPESYEVKTPVASIGVRGTIFDTLVAAVTFATTVIVREGTVFIKSFGGQASLSKKDHASTVDDSTDAPDEQRRATDDEEDLSDPLKKPFQNEIDRAGKRPTLPSNVPKPRIDPNHSRPSGNRPNYPRGPRY